MNQTAGQPSGAGERDPILKYDGRKITPARRSKKKVKRPRGRPSKITPGKIKTAEEKAAEGAIDLEIADALKIAEKSLYNYKANNPDFLQALKRGKKIADDKAEAALYSRVMGYDLIEQHIELGRDKNGKIILKDMSITRKQLAPDVLACQTWLNNRRPESWRQKIPELSNLADSVSSVLQLMRRHEEKKIKSGAK